MIEIFFQRRKVKLNVNAKLIVAVIANCDELVKCISYIHQRCGTSKQSVYEGEMHTVVRKVHSACLFSSNDHNKNSVVLLSSSHAQRMDDV